MSYLESSETVLSRADVESGREPMKGLVHHHSGTRKGLLVTTCGLEVAPGTDAAQQLGRYGETTCHRCNDIITKRGY